MNLSPRNLKDSAKDYAVQKLSGRVVECKLFFFKGRDPTHMNVFLVVFWVIFFSIDRGYKKKVFHLSEKILE